jgi:hypothetical protein
MRTDTAFHPLCSNVAAKRIAKLVSEKFAHIQLNPKIQEYIYSTLKSNLANEEWITIIQNENDVMPIFVIRNLALTDQTIINRKVYKIVIKESEKESEFTGYVGYTFNVLLASLLLLNILQFIAYLPLFKRGTPIQNRNTCFE